MNCEILTVGQRSPPWCDAACDEYLKRLKTFLPTTLIEIPAALRSKSKKVEQYKDEESQRLLKKIQSDDYVIALDVLGKSWSTEQLSQQIEQWKQRHKRIVFLIGGPDGLGEVVLKRAHQQWSLSSLTFPHMLVRVILLEQLYRAASMLSNHPYHR